MTNPKKPVSKSPQDDLEQDKEMTDDNSYDAVEKSSKFDDDDDAFDLPLDDLDTFDDSDEDEDENY